MNKQEALKAMEQGEKVTHNYFGSKEWMTLTADGKIETEEGYKHSYVEFWSYRQGESWQDGYSIYIE